MYIIYIYQNWKYLNNDTKLKNYQSLLINGGLSIFNYLYNYKDIDI